MSEKMEKEKYFFKFLLNTSENQQKMLIKTLTKSQIGVIVEVVYNTLMGNLKISDNIKKSMKRYRNVIRKFVVKGLSQRKRKAILLKYFKQFILLIQPCESWLKS